MGWSEIGVWFWEERSDEFSDSLINRLLCIEAFHIKILLTYFHNMNNYTSKCFNNLWLAKPDELNSYMKLWTEMS